LVKNFQTIISLIEDVLATSSDRKSEILKRYLEIILIEISQNNKKGLPTNNINYKRFIQLKKDLKNNFKLHKNVGFYANKQYITSKTLNIAVREIVDQSAKQFINGYIILLAKRLLTSSQLSTTEISYELGFNEPTNFVKFFKNMEGATPSVFQKVFK